MSQCFTSDMLSADEARAQLIASAHPVGSSESVPLREGVGRVLAEDVVSPLDVPGHDNSAMDGYAVRSADTTDEGVILPVSQRIPAGQTAAPLALGTAARIFTGAPMPTGADAVVMQEECIDSDGKVQIPRAITAGENVRPQGNDIRVGTQVLSAGERLRPQAIGLLASLGVAQVAVRPKLRVALLNTGDELVEPGQPLGAGQIYNSNRYSLHATLSEAGCEVIDLGQVADTFDATRAALHTAAQQADLILSSGGVSVGEEDHVRAALQADGELNLWRVRMKPGKPLAFGQLADTPFIGLPGNPVSAFVTLCLFGMPFIRVMQGRNEAFPNPGRALLRDSVTRPLARREYIRVQLRAQATGLPAAEPFPRQGSDVLTSTVWADGVLELPEDTLLDAGAELNYWSFGELLR